MNVCVISGRLTRSAELKYTENGKAMASFSVAVNRMKKEDGSSVADFFNCQMWGKYAESLFPYLNKGKEVTVRGSIYFYNYEKDGEKKTWTYLNVEKLDMHGSKKDGEKIEENTPASFEAIDNDDVPF